MSSQLNPNLVINGTEMLMIWGLINHLCMDCPFSEMPREMKLAQIF